MSIKAGTRTNKRVFMAGILRMRPVSRNCARRAVDTAPPTQPRAACVRYSGVTFDDSLEELRRAGDADLEDVVRALLGMATFAALIGRADKRDDAVRIAAELLEVRANRMLAGSPSSLRVRVTSVADELGQRRAGPAQPVDGHWRQAGDLAGASHLPPPVAVATGDDRLFGCAPVSHARRSP